MDYYRECPNCGNQEEGERVWKCQNCPKDFHCDSCEGDDRKCPHCGDEPGHGGFGHTIVGYIKNNDD